MSTWSTASSCLAATPRRLTRWSAPVFASGCSTAPVSSSSTRGARSLPRSPTCTWRSARVPTSRSSTVSPGSCSSLGMPTRRSCATRAEGMDALRARLDEFPPDRVAMLSGVDAEALRDAARRFGSATFPAIVYGLGVTEHAHGTDGVRALANLAILRGAVGTDRGAGVNPLRGQNNVQGACDMGALPDLLPGYQPVVDPVVRARFSARWGAPVPDRPGMRLPEMLVAAGEGRVRALWLIGGDVLQTYPASDRVRGALAVCDLVVCHEVFPTATGGRRRRRAARRDVPGEERDVHQLRSTFPAGPAGIGPAAAGAG